MPKVTIYDLRSKGVIKTKEAGKDGNKAVIVSILEVKKNKEK